jgi:hypothetical protein
LRALAGEAGFSGDPKTRSAQKSAAKDGDEPAEMTSWLPTGRMARLWEAASKAQQLPD